IKVTALSDQFYISPSCLTHSFKKYVGCSPKQYITMNRISYAKELLENTDIPVNVVAYKAGFGDTNNFIRTFRECFASSPNQYRKSRHNCTTNAKY
ncbi:MAG: helix-turn-helix transcriptional regulator, partial [Hydrogenoanaerobacterium sp.]